MVTKTLWIVPDGKPWYSCTWRRSTPEEIQRIEETLRRSLSETTWIRFLTSHPLPSKINRRLLQRALTHATKVDLARPSMTTINALCGALEARNSCIKTVYTFDVPYEVRGRLSAAIAASPSLKHIVFTDHLHESFFNLCTESALIDRVLARGKMRYAPRALARIPGLARIVFNDLAAVTTELVNKYTVMWPRMQIETRPNGCIVFLKETDEPCMRCGGII